MDIIDVKILRKLYWSPYNRQDVERGPMGVWDIARALDVHGNTVKRRLAELEEQGVLAGLSFFPNALILGMKVGFYSFKFANQDACSAAATTMFDAGFAGVSIQLTTPELRFNLAVRADQKPDDAAARWAEENGAVSWELITYRHWESGELTDLEQRTLQVLHQDLFATAPEIAKNLGVTPKTARRCLQALRDKEAFCIVPLVNPMAVTGLQAAIVDVDVGDDKVAAAKVWQDFPDLLPNGIHSGNYLNFIAITETPQDLASLLQEIRTIPGVRDTHANIPARIEWSALPSGLRTVSDMILEWETLTA